jgi:hypothetical protein
MTSNLKKTAEPFHKKDYKTEVEKELNENRELNAFMLIHGYIEAYLREWLFVYGKSSKESLKENILDDFDRMSFRNLVIIHSILGNINVKLFDKIQQLNKLRNDLAHELIQIDMNDNKNKKKIGNSARNGISICDEIFNLYKKRLDEKAKSLEK